MRRALVGVIVLGLAAPAWAAGRRVRPIFEPTDLELEAPGTLEADLQTGFVRGMDAERLVIPDAELDLGLTRTIELDLDGAYAIEGPKEGSFAFDHAAPDSLWPALKIGLVSVGGEAVGVGLGVQVGPKLPVASGSHGVGFEALALIGVQARRLHTVINLGTFVDPSPDVDQPRPRGLEAGLDLDLDLDPKGIFSLTAEIGAVRFFSDDPHQLVTTAGIAWQVTERLEISLVGLWGALDGGDRAGVLLGVSPKIALWH